MSHIKSKKSARIVKDYMEERYSRNIGTVTIKEQEWIRDGSVFIAGAGSLGGYVAEYLLRMGVGEIRIADFGSFTEDSFNRQFASTMENVGKSKVLELEKKIKNISEKVKLTVFNERLTKENAKQLIGNALIVVDSFENPQNKLELKEICDELDLPLVYASLLTNGGIVSTVLPKSEKNEKLYDMTVEHSIKPSVTGMAAGVIAGIQATEVINLLLGRPSLKNKMVVVDLNNYFMEIADL